MVGAGLLLGRQEPCGLPARAPRSGKPAHDAATHERRSWPHWISRRRRVTLGRATYPQLLHHHQGHDPLVLSARISWLSLQPSPLCGDIGFQQYPRWQLLLCRTCAFPDQFLKLSTFLFTRSDNVFFTAILSLPSSPPLLTLQQKRLMTSFKLVDMGH
jgi:hypothetical protein